MPSPFLNPGATSSADNVALLYVRRDQSIPTILRTYDDENQGYKEGKVVNTRFGSFPHSTLINQPWGSQIVASKVDTGSRGRAPKNAPKRKAQELEEPSGTTTGTGEEKPELKKPEAAASGFLHLMYPTPESWTLALPHRTQIVYTHDSSYILHRMRVRPGSTIIEAGAGSGSFTHASVRAVFNGYPVDEPATKKQRLGKVCSFEFHQPRAERIREEVTQHGLDGLVEVTHRDVYENGFLLGEPKSGRSPKANAIFLDLPAPWLALKHLVRKPADGSESPLDPETTVHLCTFSPCLEQAQKTIRIMRQLSWVNISMVEANNHRIEVKRERIGLDAEGVRGANVHPKSVDEAVNKLRWDEERTKLTRAARIDANGGERDEDDEEADQKPTGKVHIEPFLPRPTDPAYKLGRLIHHSEPDLKQHTSYLVFAILPRDWTEEDEQKCRQQWPSDKIEKEPKPGKSKKQIKRDLASQKMKEAKERRTAKRAAAAASATEAPADATQTTENVEEDTEMKTDA
ncbi:tRNA (adenine(58)-N(1))-methyltransferase catalytic subunit trm61 [Penicillium chermesinum]|uniref:tRNA (adenine(58)-N(1))-methyltransferase catalytic subunit TRM61 n=1 Tax=Penicillium chermesinum TaxID=63820 RepID=A0A9W9P9B7_9EURO|nr:tRNA (adenine(58)-N(1))-methyltransferase catalytic subunit trm61 [Penicillium chermesinum]KAJ5238963.1 tRNA (adenine(58)-N(1))-methyltransferase catalytic subunit trm61 [Penicillium chermesinum]KAJ6164606.1 tRNA (adenine(58)-N(1))-methyltransferase catalytic subunit trm61 [Penicillium chermesinum]